MWNHKVEDEGHLELKLNCQNQTDPLVAGSLTIDLELVQKLEDLYSLPVYMYALSSFGMKNKQYYVDGLKSTCATKLQSPTMITTIFR
jgi:hypothetical protein